MVYPLIHEIPTRHTPESLVGQLRPEEGVVLLRSASLDTPRDRYSFVAARPFLTFRSRGERCEVRAEPPTREPQLQRGDPWRALGELIRLYEVRQEMDPLFPLGGCFGYWGYDLKNFVEPKLSRNAIEDLGLPDCHLGFYDSLVAFDHYQGKTWAISTGLSADGSRRERRAQERLEWWLAMLETKPGTISTAPRFGKPLPASRSQGEELTGKNVRANLSRAEFLDRVARAQSYIRSGDIYQVNLSQRLAAPCPSSGWTLFERLSAVSPAPYSAYLDCGSFQIVSSSPELFLRLSGRRVLTRPIKGTRPRSPDLVRDAQLARELQTSAKEMAELVMITDLLRNDLGKVCQYGSVRVPELVRLERYPQVQHLVSTVEGGLRPGISHLAALASCFPGGSITGAPKFRAMEIIDELEPVTRGPYTGALGYLGFNGESQLSITIRTAICLGPMAYFHVGAGIVADSTPAAEYDETLAKAAGFLAALNAEKTPFLASTREPLSPRSTDSPFGR